jgi:hypothetical protein
MMTNENIEDTLNNEGMPVPNVWVELEGEFLDFDKHNQTLKCKFPVRDRYFNPLPTTLRRNYRFMDRHYYGAL